MTCRAAHKKWFEKFYAADADLKKFDLHSWWAWEAGWKEGQKCMQWQPIETAPIHKSVLLSFNGKDAYTGIQDNGDGLWYHGGYEVPMPIYWMPLPSVPVLPIETVRPYLPGDEHLPNAKVRAVEQFTYGQIYGSEKFEVLFAPRRDYVYASAPKSKPRRFAECMHEKDARIIVAAMNKWCEDGGEWIDE